MRTQNGIASTDHVPPFLILSFRINSRLLN